MKKLFVVFTALAATAAVVAGSALAGGSTNKVCTQGEWVTSPVTGTLDVPAGVRCFLTTEVKNTATVEGSLIAFGATFDKNVTVTGGTFKAENGGTTILGNLTITGSAGDQIDPARDDFAGNGLFGGNGSNPYYQPIHIVGNFTYTGNSAPLYVGYDDGKVNVDGNFTYNTNTSWMNVGLGSRLFVGHTASVTP
jgi:hypothetical protein